MGKSEGLDRGDWVIAIGHPRGYIKGRSPPVRLGRVLDNITKGIPLIRTDCTLVGGDSGGPLFDMNGQVIGIHSRIGPSIIYNIHVPVDCYTQDWDKLVAGDVFPSNTRPYLGVEGDPEGKECVITKVRPGTPAEKAGLKEGDVVVRFAGKKINNFEDLVRETLNQRPGAQVAIEVRRDGEMITLKATVGKKTD
jgi:serine protease Do